MTRGPATRGPFTWYRSLFAVVLMVGLVACVGVTGLDTTGCILLACLGLGSFALRVGRGRSRSRGCMDRHGTNAKGDQSRHGHYGDPLLQVHFIVLLVRIAASHRLPRTLPIDSQQRIKRDIGFGIKTLDHEAEIAVED